MVDMAGKKRQGEEAQIRRYHELNVARQNLIAIQRQIPEGYSSWSYHGISGEQEFKISCSGKPDLGVPHGLDSDVYAAILSLYMKQGSEDSKVSCSAYELLKEANIDPSGKGYAALQRSLERLYSSQYEIKSAWRDHTSKKWMSVTFQHIVRMAQTQSELENLTAASQLEITLPEEIVNSIRAGYIFPTSGRVLSQLDQPNSRALYRTLEANRRDALDPLRQVNELHFNLFDWARILKLAVTDDAYRIRRSLERSHEDLVRVGYLREVQYSGRADNQQVSYVFETGYERIPDPDLLQLLHEKRVARTKALELVQNFPERIHTALVQLDVLLSTGYKPRSKTGLLIDIIEHPERYQAQLAQSAELVQSIDGPEKEKPVAKPVALEVAPDDSFEQLSLDQKAQRLVKTAEFRYRLSLIEKDILHSMVMDGTINADEVFPKVAYSLNDFDIRTLLSS